MSQTMPPSVSPAQAQNGGGHRVNKPRRLNPPPARKLYAQDNFSPTVYHFKPQSRCLWND